MPKIPLKTIISYCDKILRTRDQSAITTVRPTDCRWNSRGRSPKSPPPWMPASPRSNSLSPPRRICSSSITDLFWSPSHPWTGKKHELLRLLVENNLAVYSSHLPLDVHPKLGNNAQLCVALGLKNLKPFFLTHGQTIGFKSQTEISRAELAKRLERATGAKPKIIPGGNEICERIGVVTGGAGGDLKIAADEGVDTFITGEGPQWTFALAEELGLNVLYGGHYATETFGVKALAAHLSEKFRLPWEFLDHPTGL